MAWLLLPMSTSIEERQISLAACGLCVATLWSAHSYAVLVASCPFVSGGEDDPAVVAAGGAHHTLQAILARVSPALRPTACSSCCDVRLFIFFLYLVYVRFPIYLVYGISLAFCFFCF